MFSHLVLLPAESREQFSSDLSRFVAQSCRQSGVLSVGLSMREAAIVL
jgi:hypothetical protein